MMSADALLLEFKRQLAACGDVKRWLIGYSGGLDSRVLVELAAEVLEPSGVLLLHVNHQLQAQAPAWAARCVAEAARLGLAIRVVDVVPASASEADARDARYEAFVRELKPGDMLLLGHHADDQAETLLLRLVRGAGPRGLAGMPRQRRLGDAQLLRPLLAFSRSQLESWAGSRGLDWVEDPSNARIDYDRNFVRHQVLQPLRERWPGVTSRLVLSADLLSETTELVEALARIDLDACKGPHACLAGPALAGLAPARRRNLLRFWVNDQTGVSLNAPLLARIEQDVLQAAPDRQPSLRLGGFCLRRYRADLFLVPLRRHSSDQTLAAITLTPGLLELPGGRLSVVARTATAGSPDCLRTLEAVHLRYRRDGERCRPVGRNGSHPLKKLFQEAGIAPWLRDEWPLLVCADEIVAVAGLWVCEGWQAEAGEPGYALDWQRA